MYECVDAGRCADECESNLENIFSSLCECVRVCLIVHAAMHIKLFTSVGMDDLCEFSIFIHLTPMFMIVFGI